MKFEELVDLVKNNHQRYMYNFSTEQYEELKKAAGGSDLTLVYDLATLLNKVYSNPSVINEELECEVEKLRYENKRLQDYDKVRIENLMQAYKTINALREKNSELWDECKVYRDALNNINGNLKQKELVRAGKKLAYRSDISDMRVKELLDEGKTIKEIAEALGGSVGTINNRIKSLKKKGLVGDNVRKRVVV